jgi:Tfp pilus assembly protein PilV
MRKIFKKTTQNKEQGDYVLRRPRNSIRENYLGSMFEFCRLVSLGWDPSARTEADEPSRDQKIFQQKNTCDSRLRGNDRKAGFTLVETLVAISVLMLAVTGPLFYASESLKAATYARDQITAFYLAQDAFEQIRKIRDDNLYVNSAAAWYSGLQGCENLQTLDCIVAKDESNFYKVATISNEENKFLYVDSLGGSSNGLYSHKSGEGQTKTIFKRSVRIEPTDGTDPNDLWKDATEMKVTVFVEWDSRGTKRNFTAYEFLRKLK